MRLPDEVTIELGLDDPDDAVSLRERVARELGISEAVLPEIALRKRSLDARRGHVRFRAVFAVNARRDGGPAGGSPLREVSQPARVLIVGDGPAGLFCAYELARAGVGSIVLDRGKTVQPRRHDLKGLNRRGIVDPDSNYCFGEGGAGTYSDGKLYTRSHKRGNVRDVLEALAGHGAPEAILSDARPHIGSNRLPKVVTALREDLERVGVSFRFGSRVVDLLIEPCSAGRRCIGVRLADGAEICAEQVVLATGHSARDMFEMLLRLGVGLKSKGFALGARIEHPQPLINQIQYGRLAGHRKLPSAYYRIAANIAQHGVFSFCMCPGGFVVPASTEADGLVVNGMSLSKRDSPFANSGLVVSLEPHELERAGFHGPLGGVELQRRIERAACVAGAGKLRAPATRATDFLRRRASSSVPESSYLPGLTATNLSDVLDCAGLDLSGYLREALGEFERTLRGYLTDEAVLIGVESRTSSPVRVTRDPEALESPDLRGVYPCGEGAGYAGGIVSAALDGARVGRQIALTRRGQRGRERRVQ